MNAFLKRAAKRLLVTVVSVSMVFVQIPVMAQTSEPADQAELDRLLAPIALYPDPLLTQILMASTYPIEVVQAARWSKQNPQLKGEDAVQAVDERDWDPSVKALVAFPQILERMDQQLEWTTALGDAFLSQQEQVMDTVQGLRQRAQQAGNLSSNEHVRVIERERVIVIEPAQPRVVYVPWYDPWVVYGAWWWPAYPPVRWAAWHGYPARSSVHSEIVWGIGIGITVGLLFAAIDWPHRHVKVVHVHHPMFRKHVVVHRAGPGPYVWRHDPVHRRGVVYRDHHVRERYEHRRSADAPGPRSAHRGDDARRDRAQPRIDAPRRDARPEPRGADARREQTRPERDAPRETRREPRSETHRDANPERRSEPRLESPRDERRESRRDARSEASPDAAPAIRPESRPETRRFLGTEMRRDATPEIRRESRSEARRFMGTEMRREARPESRRDTPIEAPRGIRPEARRDARIEVPREVQRERRHERSISRETPRAAVPRGEVRPIGPARGGRDFEPAPRERSASRSSPREYREHSRGRDASRGRPEARSDAAPGHRARASRSDRRDRRPDAGRR